MPLGTGKQAFDYPQHFIANDLTAFPDGQEKQPKLFGATLVRVINKLLPQVLQLCILMHLVNIQYRKFLNS